MNTVIHPVTVPKLTEAEIESIFKSGGFYLEGKRAERFRAAVLDICGAQESLSASSNIFPSVCVDLGEIDPQYAVETFSEYVNKRLRLLMSSMANKDLKDHPFLVLQEAE